MNKIETLEVLRNTRVHRFPTYAKQGMRVLRFDELLVATDPQGRIYTNRVRHRGQSIGMMSAHGQARVVIALRRMGLLGEGVGVELEKEAEAEHRQQEARYALGDADRLEKLGVPYTKSQLRRLRAAAGVAS
jgi:hypothetical protein